MVIGDDCELQDATLGPDVSVGDGVRLVDCRLRNSVILERCEIVRVAPVIADSLMGQACRIGPLNVGAGSTGALRLLLADDSILEGVASDGL